MHMTFQGDYRSDTNSNNKFFVLLLHILLKFMSGIAILTHEYYIEIFYVNITHGKDLPRKYHKQIQLKYNIVVWEGVSSIVDI